MQRALAPRGRRLRTLARGRPRGFRRSPPAKVAGKFLALWLNRVTGHSPARRPHADSAGFLHDRRGTSPPGGVTNCTLSSSADCLVAIVPVTTATVAVAATCPSVICASFCFL